MSRSGRDWVTSEPPSRTPRRLGGTLGGGAARPPAAAALALLELADSPLGRKHKSALAVWERAWERFIPFLAFPPELRKVIDTTNTIESLNYQIRKIIKNRGHFPTDDAVVKLLWLAICGIEDNRPAPAKPTAANPLTNAAPPPASSKDQSPLVGKQALAALDEFCEQRNPNPSTGQSR